MGHPSSSALSALAIDAGGPGAPWRDVVAFASLAYSVLASDEDRAIFGSHGPLPHAGTFLALCRASELVLHFVRHGGDL